MPIRSTRAPPAGDNDSGESLSAGTAQMLVLGITDIRQAGTAYRSLLAAQPGWPVLIVYRPAESRIRPEIAA